MFLEALEKILAAHAGSDAIRRVEAGGLPRRGGLEGAQKKG